MAGLLMKYFVLKPAGNDWHARACREALKKYAEVAKNHNSELADDLSAWVADEQRKAEGR